MAVIRGSLDIVRALVEAGANRNAKDFDENSPLHMASEFGHASIIIYLIKECQADPMLKNKFGYYPPDIAQNYSIQQLFEGILPQLYAQQSNSDSILGSEESKSFYGRTAYNGVLRHNDRVNAVQRLMNSYKNVDKFLQTKN